jgi:putative membrane protein
MPEIDRQREHQANERTFLAWLRTSIALIGFGFALARFGLFLRQLETAVTKEVTPTYSFISYPNPGVGLVIVGIFVIVLAVWRYNRVFWQIERGAYQPNRLMIWAHSRHRNCFGTPEYSLTSLATGFSSKLSFFSE